MLADIHGQLKKRGIVADVQDGISSLTLQDCKFTSIPALVRYCFYVIANFSGLV